MLDIEQALLLLELEPPFDKRDVQLARRRQAKVWHPDLAPPGKQTAHERHLKAINEAADELERIDARLRGDVIGIVGEQQVVIAVMEKTVENVVVARTLAWGEEAGVDPVVAGVQAAAIVGATLMAGLEWLVFHPERSAEQVASAVLGTLR